MIMNKTSIRYAPSLVLIAALLIYLLSSAQGAFAQDAGSRASFTRGGWAGARYVAMGKAAEVIVDDVFAIYWNPAGLSELKGKKSLTPEQIKDRAKKGDMDKISEEDLIKFSEADTGRSFVNAGFSAAMLDVEREAGFAGVAFNMFKGVMGAGLLYIQSRDIEARDVSGNYLKKMNYAASTGFLSYAWNSGVSSFGFSIKGLNEKIGDVEYIGGGLDVGTQIELIPFFKIGFVIQDIGTGLKPMRSYENIKNKYDFGSPSLKLSAALTNRTSDFLIAVTGVKKLEQERYEFNVGIQYELYRQTSIYIGLNDSRFASGISVKIYGLDISYAFAYDNINLGYNNVVSLTLEF